MKRTITKFAAIIAATMFSTASWSADLANNGAALDGVLDGIATDGSIDTNVVTDQLGDSLDSYWSVGGTGGSISTMIIELAALANTNEFGIYDMTDHTNSVVLFDGLATAGSQITLQVFADGSVRVHDNDTLTVIDTGVFAGNAFGFYLNNPTSGFGGPATFYSDTALNGDGIDHMAAYQGTGEQVQILPFAAGPWGANEYILAWEDINGGGDMDFTDFVVMVESVSPVPEPSVLALLGLGMLGMGFARRRKNC